MDIQDKEAQATGVLGSAERILDEWASSADPVHRDLLLLQTSFLVRLAAALLIEPDFPALPGGFEPLLDRDRARVAARQLAESRGRRYRSFSKRASKPTPPDRTGSPQTEIDRRLAAETAGTLEDLQSVRRDLFREYLDLASRDEASSLNPEVQTASLALVDGYWRSGRQLLSIEHNGAQKPRRSSRRGDRVRLRRPLWADAIPWEFRRSFDPRFLLWSDPLPNAHATPESTAPCRKNCDGRSHEL